MLKQFLSNRTKRFQQISALLVVAAVGTYLLVGSHAATPYASIAADKGTLTGGATQQTCTGASDGSCVMFGSSSSSNKLIVGLNDIVGFGAPIAGTQPESCKGADPCYLSTMYINSGVTWARDNINQGDPNSLSLINASWARPAGLNILPVYESGNDGDGNCLGGTPGQVTSDMGTILPALKSDNIHVLEMCNESYLTLCAAQYAPLYNAAHQAIASFDAQNNYKITLLSVEGTDYYQSHGYNVAEGQGFTKTCAGNDWFTELAANLPGGAAEVDGFTLHPYPNNPAPDGSNINASGPAADGSWWGMIPTQHTEAVNAGFTNQPWWITEAGITYPGEVNSDAVKGQYLQYMLNDIIAGHYPWIAAFFWYSDTGNGSSGDWGLLNESSTNPFEIQERGSFNDLQNWMSQHAGSTNG